MAKSKFTSLVALKNATKALKGKFSNSKKSAKSSKFKIAYKFEKLEDEQGHELHVPVLEVGAPVTVSNGSDEATPANDGNYMLVDGVEIVVVDGLISEIVYPENFNDEDKEKEEENFEDSKEVAEVAEAVEAVVTEVAEATEAVATEVEELKAEIEALNEKVLEMSKAPAKASVTKKVENTSANPLAGLFSRK